MNERKFRKKIDDMTAEEKQRKDSLWQSVSLETGIDGAKKSSFSLRLALTVATAVLAICIAVPLVIVGVGKFGQQTATGSNSGDTNISQSGFVSAKDPNRFTDNEFIYAKSTLSIAELADKDSNILYVSEWGREVDSTELMKDKADTNRIIGVRDNARYGSESQITIDILYTNISVVSFDKTIADMHNVKKVNGIDVSWSSLSGGGVASFKYNGYTYLIQVKTPSGDAALSAAETLIKSKAETILKKR